MNIAPASQELTFEVTYDSPSLHIGMSVYDTTGASPLLVSGPTAMTNVVGNTYIGKFTPSLGHSYLIFKAVYTTSGLDTLDSNYSQGSESIVGAAIGGAEASSSGCFISGFVPPQSDVVGVVEC